MELHRRAGPAWVGMATCALLAGGLVAAAPEAAGGVATGSDELTAVTAELERWLDENSPYPAAPAPARLAVIDLDEAQALDRRAVRKGRLRALYDDKAAIIYLIRPWAPRSARDKGVLLHELAHHRQATARHWYCAQAQEWGAYKLQSAWLAERGIDAGFYWPAILLESSCAKRDIHPD